MSERRACSRRARGRGELDDLGERPCAALLCEPEQRDEDLGRGDGVGQRAVAGLARRAEEVRELAQREALAPAVEKAAREPDGVDDGGGDPAAREPLDRAVDEADVEAGVVSAERRVAGEREEPADRELGSRRAAELGVLQAGQPRDRRRQRHAGLHERLERVRDLERLDANRTDLADAVTTRGEPGRLEVEDDDLGVLDERLGAGLAGEPDACAAPHEARVAVDDVGEERVRQRDGSALEREEHARGVLRRDGAATRVDQLDETVGGVERELHPTDRIRTYVRLQGQTKGRPASRQGRPLAILS